jgi:predicted O-methyltransferase YrrM
VTDVATRFGIAERTKGFMPEVEGLALFEFARHVRGTTWLELGAWCGKSTVYLGAAAAITGATVFSLDHHHGSEEQQVGWPYFDESLVDPTDGRLNTLPSWQRTIALADLESTVVGLVGTSAVIAPHFHAPLDLLFLDGGHGEDVAWRDYRDWTPKVVVGGLVLLHDVFANPADGGRPPYEIYCHALASGDFIARGAIGSLHALERCR